MSTDIDLPHRPLPPLRKRQSRMTEAKRRIALKMHKMGYIYFDIAAYIDVNWGRVSEAIHGKRRKK